MKTIFNLKGIILTAFLTLVASQMQAASTSLKEVDGLIMTTYIIALIAAVVALLVAALISTMIANQGGTNPKDPGKRRLWFWVLAILTPIGFFAYELTSVIPFIKKGPALAKFGLTHVYSTAMILVVYVILGIILSKVMKRGKLGNWFPSKS